MSSQSSGNTNSLTSQYVSLLIVRSDPTDPCELVRMQSSAKHWFFKSRVRIALLSTTFPAAVSSKWNCQPPFHLVRQWCPTKTISVDPSWYRSFRLPLIREKTCRRDTYHLDEGHCVWIHAVMMIKQVHELKFSARQEFSIIARFIWYTSIHFLLSLFVLHYRPIQSQLAILHVLPRATRDRVT